MECLRWRGSTDWVYLDSADLNFSNRPVRTRMPGGVAGARPDGRLLCRFFKRQKSTQKGSPRASGPSLRLGVPSLRHLSGGIALRLASLAPTCDEFDCVERRCAPIPG